MALGVVGTDFRRTVWHQPSWIVTQALVRLVVALQTEAVRAAVDVLALGIWSHKSPFKPQCITFKPQYTIMKTTIYTPF